MMGLLSGKSPENNKSEPPEPLERLDLQRDKLIMWRTEGMYQAGRHIGLRHKEAYAMANDRDIDLHRAVKVLEGCEDLDLALKILL